MAAGALLALVSTVLCGAEVYRSTDASGTVSYSDRPQSDNAEFIFIATPRPTTPSPQPATVAAAAAQPAGVTETIQPTAEERAAERVKNCSTARQRLQTYTTAHRLYRATENGEREYLNDAQIDEARARAEADVETWCD
jgi:hypothetical protein